MNFSIFLSINWQILSPKPSSIMHSFPELNGNGYFFNEFKHFRLRKILFKFVVNFLKFIYFSIVMFALEIFGDGIISQLNQPIFKYGIWTSFCLIVFSFSSTLSIHFKFIILFLFYYFYRISNKRFTHNGHSIPHSKLIKNKNQLL